MRSLVILGLVVACRVPDEHFIVGDAGSTDDGSCNAWPFTPSNFDPCADDFPPSTGPAMLDGTSSIDALGSSYRGIRLLHVDSLTVTTAVTLTGTQPLLIASDGDVMIAGSVDVSRIAAAGPGCGIVVPADNLGGGPGGGLGFDGGTGGPGGLLGSTTAGGHFAGDTSLIPLVMGCAGGPPVPVSGTLALPGQAGGAIEISSRTAITITATGAIISDGGGGGGGILESNMAGGGAGGGSGGAIVIEAQSLALAMGARLCAVGGAGGQGASRDVNATPGHAGGDGTGCMPGTPTSNSFGGGDGGAGAAGTGAAGGSNASSGGGGGGGGGIIHITGHVTLQNQGATIKPPATM